MSTPQTWAAKNGAKALIYLAIAAVIVIVAWSALRARDSAKETKAAGEQAVRTDQAANDIFRNVQAGTSAQTAQEAVVAEVRVTHEHKYEQIIKSDPVVRDWASQPIDQRLRDAARQRRLDRERLGRDGAGRGGDAPPP